MEKKLELLKTKMEADNKIADDLLKLDTPEEVQSYLKEKGVDFSIDEIKQLKEMLVKFLQLSENDELTDEALEDVAGGFVFATFAAVAGLFVGTTVAAGTALGLGIIGAGVNEATNRRW